MGTTVTSQLTHIVVPGSITVDMSLDIIHDECFPRGIRAHRVRQLRRHCHVSPRPTHVSLALWNGLWNCEHADHIKDRRRALYARPLRHRRTGGLRSSATAVIPANRRLPGLLFRDFARLL